MPRFETTPWVETGGLLAGPITAYLQSTDKTMNEAVLAETVHRMRQVIVKDLMQPRHSRVGKEHSTLYTHACARKSRLVFEGASRDPLQARTLLKFLLGDLVELSILALARLAGCELVDNNIDLTVRGEDGALIPVHPDGRLAVNGQYFNVEIKSCDSRTFDTWLERGGPTDDWGYLTQHCMEIEAWRQAGWAIDETLFVAVSTGSRQGSIAEFRVPYREELVRGWHERRAQARGSRVPEIPFEPSLEMDFLRGKECAAEWFAHGTPQPRTNEKGHTYGWDVPTGRTVVPLPCTYCDFRSHHCWPTAELEVRGGKPLWVTPPLSASR